MESYKVLNPIHQCTLPESDKSNIGKKTEYIGKCNNNLEWILLTDDDEEEIEIRLFSYGKSTSYNPVGKTILPLSMKGSQYKFILLKRWSVLLQMNLSIQPSIITLFKFNKQTNGLDLTNSVHLQTSSEGVRNAHPSWTLSYDEHKLVIVEQIHSVRNTKHQRPGFFIHKISITNPYETQKAVFDSYIETRSVSFEQLSRVGYSEHEMGKPFLDCYLINNGGTLLIVKSSPIQRYLSSQTLSTFLLYDMTKDVVITSIQRPSAELGYIVTKTKESKNDYVIRSTQSASFEIIPLAIEHFGVKSRLLTLEELGVPINKRITKVTTQNGCLFMFYTDTCYMVGYDNLENHNSKGGIMFKLNIKTFSNEILTSRFIPSCFTDFDSFQISVFRVLPTLERLKHLEVFQTRSCNSLYRLCCRYVNKFFQSNKLVLANIPQKIKNDLKAL